MGEADGEPTPDVADLLEQVLNRLVRRPPQAPVASFPDPDQHASPEGLVAISRAVTPEMVLDAYAKGLFPMAEPDLIGWWCPDPRTVLDLESLHVPRRLGRTVRQGKFEIRVDTAFDQVIAACADREETWISPELNRVYTELFRRGHVHTVETWRAGQLVGGLYGVSLGGAFMAESMFHRERDASKVAVVELVERLRARGFGLLDIQFETKATAIFRPRKLPRAEYLRRLKAALKSDATFV